MRQSAATASPRAGAADGLQAKLRTSLDFADGPGELAVELQLAPGEWLGLRGPSGAGKSSLLRLLAGLARPRAGELRVDGETWFDAARGIDLPTRRRRCGVVFQDLALFPHLDARRQVAFALPSGAAPEEADAWLERVGLGGLAGRYPAQLSGGQQQRLALARTLAARPRLLLLDEPLAALDAGLRRDMQDLLGRLRAERHVAYVLLVTHDDGEAARLVDRSLHLERGRLRAAAPNCPN